jgi:hypothetical protein
MWDFNIGKTIGIMARTLPFILIRMAVYFGITLAYIIATGAGAGIGYGVGNVGSDPGSFSIWGGIIGFGLVSGVVYWLREYVLYTVKAGHIAVIVEMLDGRPMPQGKSQFEHATETVKSRFAEMNVLFVLDQLIKGVIRALTGLISGVAFFLPIPGLDGIVRFINTVIRLSLTYVDEIILGYNIRINSQNPWETSRQGLVLYAQNGKTMVKNALWLSIFLWILAIVVFILMLAPAGAIVYLFPGAFSGWSFVVAIIFAWAFKAAVLEPFAITALMDVYFRAIEGQQPNPEWDAKLASASSKFRDLKDRAMESMGVRQQA